MSATGQQKAPDKDDRRPFVVQVVEKKATLLERVPPYAALVVSLAAIVVSVLQVRENVTNNKLSVTPYLATYTSLYTDDPRGIVGIEIKSAGLGPAIVRKKDLYLDGKKVESLGAIANTPEVRKMTKAQLDYLDFWGAPFLPPGVEGKQWLLSTRLDNVLDLKGFEDLVEKRVRLLIVSCSVYDECWEECIGGDASCKGMPDHLKTGYPKE